MDEVDITEVTTGAELRPLSGLGDSEAWAMVESSPDGMILADESGVMMLVNAQIETLFGYDRGELLGRPVEELLPERHRQVHKAHRTRYRAAPRVRAMGTDLDLWARRKDGSEFPVEVSLSPIKTHNGLRVVATVRDVIERFEAEAHTHAVMHTIDRTQDGLFMFTADTLQFSYVNHGAVKQLGYSSEELLTMSPLHIKPEFSEASFRDLLEPILAGEVESQVITTLHRRKDGSDLPVEIVIEYPPAIPGGNQTRMFVALVRDITERIEAEEALRANENARGRLEDRERLARDLHDLVIQQLFAAGMGLQSVQSLIDNSRAAKRVMDTVTQLDQTIAELRSAIFALTTPTPETVASQLAGIVANASIQLGFTPTLDFVGDSETIPGVVVEQLLPTLTEALSNVARHAAASAVSISLIRDTTNVVLSVSDDGVGVDPSRPRGNGLNNLQARAERVGGSARLEGNPEGRGSVLVWSARI